VPAHCKAAVLKHWDYQVLNGLYNLLHVSKVLQATRVAMPVFQPMAWLGFLLEVTVQMLQSSLPFFSWQTAG
jgi:hypothetical protein